MEQQKPMFAFIGSYAEANTPSIYSCAYDEKTGSLQLLHQVEGLKNPTFLEVHGEQARLYAITESVNEEGHKCGAAAAFAINPSTGEMSLINKEITLPATTCHIALDHTYANAIVASYHGGMVGVSPILEDGRIGATADIKQHEGSSVLPVQSQPRAHSVFIDANNRYAAACDLGADKLVIYKLDAENHRLIPHGTTEVAPGSGPRHFAFHPSKPYGYVINELGSTVMAFHYAAEQGTLEHFQTISTLPEGFEGENGTADIHISNDGRFLYGSNRGHDSIVVYAIDEATGKLQVVEYASTLGGHPRNFGLSPDNRFVLVANRDGNNIVTFARDEATGKLTATGSELSVSKPVCIKFSTLG